MATVIKTAEALNGVVVTLAAFTAPATSDIVKIDSGGRGKIQEITFSCTVVLNSCSNVVLRFLGGLTAADMGKLSYDGLDRTITADGTYNFRYKGVRTLVFFAVTFVSEAGATDSTIAVTLKAG